jgi:hypothetical protein
LRAFFLLIFRLGKGQGRGQISLEAERRLRARQQRLLHPAEHSLSDLLAFFLAGGGGHGRQKSIDGVPRHGETCPSAAVSQPRTIYWSMQAYDQGAHQRREMSHRVK